MCRCRLNRSSSKRWENATLPINGSAVLVSGCLDGKGVEVMRVDVEVMRFVPNPSSEGVGSPHTPARTKFGIPKRLFIWFVKYFY